MLEELIGPPEHGQSESDVKIHCYLSTRSASILSCLARITI